MKQLWMDWQTFAEDAEAGQETYREVFEENRALITELQKILSR